MINHEKTSLDTVITNEIYTLFYNLIKTQNDVKVSDKTLNSLLNLQYIHIIDKPCIYDSISNTLYEQNPKIII